MLIKESMINQPEETTLRLAEMEFIEESINFNPAALVPVIESTERNTLLVDLNDVLTFAESQGIDDLGYATSLICEASQIDPNKISFTIDETSIIAYDHIASLVEGMMAGGVKVFAKPLSKDDEVYNFAESILQDALETGDYTLLEAFLNDDQEAFNEGSMTRRIKRNMAKKAAEEDKGFSAQAATIANAAVAKKQEKKGKPVYNPANTPDTPKGGFQLNLKEPEVYKSDTSTTYKVPESAKKSSNVTADTKEAPKALPAGEKKGGALVAVNQKVATTGGPDSATEEKLKGMADKNSSKWANKPKEWYARIIKWLKDKSTEFNKKLKSDGENAALWRKLLGYVTRAIQNFTEKMSAQPAAA